MFTLRGVKKSAHTLGWTSKADLNNLLTLIPATDEVRIDAELLINHDEINYEQLEQKLTTFNQQDSEKSTSKIVLL